MDEDAFKALEDCVYSGEYGACEAVPAGEPAGCLVNPTGGRAVDMAGPARWDVQDGIYCCSALPVQGRARERRGGGACEAQSRPSVVLGVEGAELCVYDTA